MPLQSVENPAPASEPSKKVAPEDKVPIHQKIAYGLGATNDMWGNWLYPGLVWPVFNIFLLVNPALVSTALMVNRLVDAVSDPFFGWLSDNARTRWGRRRPFILVGSILAGLSLPLLFAVQPGWSEAAYFWFMIGSSGVFITIVSCFNMPWQSLGAELTPDYHERTSVYSYKSGIQKIPEVAMFAAAAFATATVWIGATGDNVVSRLGLMISQTTGWFGDFFLIIFTGEFGRMRSLFATPFGWEQAGEGQLPNTLLGAQVYTVILGSIMVLVGFIVFFFVKERYYGNVVARGQDRVAITETIYKTLRNRPFRAQICMALSYGLGTSMVGTLGYYATVYYVCQGNVTLGSLWNFGMGLSNMVIGVLGIPTFAFIARRIGKRGAMMCVQVSAICVFIGTWWLYNPDIKWLQLLASGMIAFTGAGFWMLYGSIGADVIDHDELQTGKRREGAFTACGTWIMKVGMAIGIGLSGVILATTGFDAGLGPDQAEYAITRIRFYLAAIPVVGLLIALVALALFGLTQERMAAIRKELEARRGIV